MIPRRLPNQPVIRPIAANTLRFHVLLVVVSLALTVSCKYKPHASRSGANAATAATLTTTPLASIAQSASPGNRVLDSPPVKVERKYSAMGTSIQFIVYTKATVNAAGVGTAIDRAFQEVQRLEALLSEWRDDSDVGRVNQAAGEWVTVGPETAEVIDEALWVSRASQGAFDITFRNSARHRVRLRNFRRVTKCANDAC